MEIATIAESDTVVIEAELDDAWSGKVKKGDKALIRFGTSEFLGHRPRRSGWQRTQRPGDPAGAQRRLHAGLP